MIVYKTTSKKHTESAVAEGNLRIGTFEYYKKYDHPEIGDTEEGMETVIINAENENLILEGKDVDKLIRRAGFGFHKEWKIELKKGAKLIVDNEFNTFVFCCAFSDTEDIKINSEFGNSSYIICDSEKFADIVGYYLLKKIKENFQGKCPDKYWYFHDKVRYGSKNLEISKIYDIPEFTKTIHLDQIMTKDWKFKNQNEYRFIWFFGYADNNEMVSLGRSVDYFDILAPEVSQFLVSNERKEN